MKIELELDKREEYILEALRGTDQWGDTLAEVAKRLMNQRVWQLCGDTLDASRIGAERAEKAANQITKPK